MTGIHSRHAGIVLCLAATLSVSLAAGCKDRAMEPSKQMRMEADGGSAGGFADSKTAPAEEAPAAPPPRETSNAAKPGAQPLGAAADKEKAKNPTAGLYIIRRATLILQVPSVRPAIKQVAALVAREGGFVSDSRLEVGEGDVPTATLTARVPVRHFDRVVGELGGIGTLRSSQVNGEDVSLEFVDTTSRVRNLQKEEATLLKLLERTGKLSDVLEVERELSRVRGEIEQAQGRLRQLGNLVDLATIEITLSEQVQETNASPWNLGPTFENAVKDTERWLAASLATAVAGLVWLGGYLLLLIPAFLLFLLVGWALGALLVDNRKLLSRRLFQRAWAVVGAALLCLAFPPLLGLAGLLGVLAAALWVGSLLFGRFFGRRELD